MSIISSELLSIHVREIGNSSVFQYNVICYAVISAELKEFML